MRIATLTALSILTTLAATGQTYFYINSIEVDPPSPTTFTPVTVTVNGDLSNTASFIVNTSYAVNGFDVDITVNAGNQGIGLDVLVPHIEVFSLGLLAAGTYTISFAGTNILDLAPAPQHQFIVAGGGASACDSILIDYVRWQPFADTALEVHALNIGQTCFDYPGFVLLQGSDTLAKQEVYFFCVPSDASHLLDPHPGATMPTGPFSGELHLWTGFYSEQQCIFQVETELCPPEPCTTLMPYLNNYGNSLVDVTLAWALNNSEGVAVAVGEFTLIDSVQSDYDTVCIAPGLYTLIVGATPPIGGQLVFGMSTGVPYGGDVGANYVQNNLPNALTTTYYGPCIDAGNGMGDFQATPVLTSWIEDDQLRLRRSDGSSIGEFNVLDATGRIIRSGTIPSANGSVVINSLANGAYLFHSSNSGSIRFVHER